MPLRFTSDALAVIGDKRPNAAGATSKLLKSFIKFLTQNIQFDISRIVRICKVKRDKYFIVTKNRKRRKKKRPAFAGLFMCVRFSKLN